jgi:hypothetical protein
VSDLRIEPATRVARSNGAIAERVDEGTLVLNPDTDGYVRLNRTGTWVWEALETPSQVDALAARLAREFEIPPSDALGDVVAFLGQLAGQGLVSLTDQRA